VPFLSNSALSAFILNPGDYHITLHTEDVPALANELHVETAPGYAHQAATLGPALAFGEITFGPATGHWPTVRSIGVREGVPISNPLAYHTLPEDRRFKCRAGDAYTIPNGYLGTALSRALGDAAGWTLTPEQMDDWLLHHTQGYRLSGADLDPGGTVDDLDEAALIPGAIRLYESNPRGRSAGLRYPLRELRRTEPLTWRGDALDDRVLLLYWSPLYNALVPLHATTTTSGLADTATHWALSRSGDWPADLSQLAYTGPLNPAIPLTQNETLGFPARGFRVRMPV